MCVCVDFSNELHLLYTIEAKRGICDPNSDISHFSRFFVFITSVLSFSIEKNKKQPRLSSCSNGVTNMLLKKSRCCCVPLFAKSQGELKETERNRHFFIFLVSHSQQHFGLMILMMMGIAICSIYSICTLLQAIIFENTQTTSSSSLLKL